jgi:uncharacterized protein YigE (DUF2233 family)
MVLLKTRPTRALLAVLAGVALMLLGAPSPLVQDCSTERFEGTAYFVCAADPESADLRMFWQNADGAPHRHFGSVAQALADRGETLTFAINGGMYGQDYAPIGLYVEDGSELRPVNTRVVEGPPAQVPNFYKRPNGIFLIDDDGAAVITTEAYLEAPRSVRFATQSGPMLVIDNGLHPALIEGSRDRTRRSGVGVCEGGVVRFAASEGSVNFHDFARMFRDHLHCPNALFLDGGRGVGIYHAASHRNDRSWHGGFGPMIGIVE